MLETKPLAGTAEAAYDFIGNKQDVVFVEDPLDFRPVTIRSDDYTTRTLYGLSNESGHVVFTQFQDFFFKSVCCLDAEFFRTQVTALGIPVWLINMYYIGDGVELFVHEAHSAQCCSGNGTAVIGIFAADYVTLFRLLLQVPIATHNSQDSIVTLRT